jgi:hypothetical protein
MADSSHVSQLTRSNSIRPRYKIIAYIVAWLVALFATNPNGGLWALVWMFPLGLAAFINPRWANSGGWGVFGACIEFILFMRIFTSALETFARRSFCSVSSSCSSSAMSRGAGR